MALVTSRLSKQLIAELHTAACPEQAKRNARFFKTDIGQYAEHDIFMGLSMPQLRQITTGYLKDVFLQQKHPSDLCWLDPLITSAYHEVRLAALLCLVQLMTRTLKKKGYISSQSIYDYYVAHRHHINNWDLVDCSAHYIVGRHLINRSRKPLHQWVKSPHIWTCRIAMVSQWWFIRQHDLTEIFKLVNHTLARSEDLMHKASGWMLREAGKKNKHALIDYLDIHAHHMPRTMLRYAIEHFEPARRQTYLNKKAPV